MGLLGKAAAVRWISQGRGGGGDDGGAGLVLVIIAAVMGAVLLVTAALTKFVQIVTSVLYATLRPILIVAPRVSVIVCGIAVAGMLALMPKYAPATAKAVLTDEDSRDTSGFYTKGLVIVGLLLVANYLVVVERTGFITSLFAGYIPHPIFHGILNLIWGIIFFYLLCYKIFHLPYRCHRLLGHATYGRFVSIGTLFPLTALVVAGGFGLPLGLDLPVTALSSFALSSGIIISVHALPLVFVKTLAEEPILQLETDERKDTS